MCGAHTHESNPRSGPMQRWLGSIKFDSANNMSATLGYLGLPLSWLALDAWKLATVSFLFVDTKQRDYILLASTYLRCQSNMWRGRSACKQFMMYWLIIIEQVFSNYRIEEKKWLTSHSQWRLCKRWVRGLKFVAWSLQPTHENGTIASCRNSLHISCIFKRFFHIHIWNFY